MKTEKTILDACCGSRMFWFDRNNPDVMFTDIRKENHILCDGRALDVNPEFQMDFRDLKFDDNTFRLVVFDPPHIDNLGESSWMAKKYGVLNKDTWKEDIGKGFNECYRVLQSGGVLVFKWNEHRVKLTEVLKVISERPLFGHVTGKHGRTIWMTFMKP